MGNPSIPGSPVKPRITGNSPLDTNMSAARPMIQCPKCGADARDIARFCPKCHMTLRYQCPSCSHEQRHGGTCDQCGVDFLKYVGAVVAGKKAEADIIHERFEKRSSLLKHILWTPFSGGFSLVRYLFGSRDK